MEGVGARLGRTSTRYAPTTVFNGPVRKWKKNWVSVSPPNHSQTSNANNNNNNGSHLLLYKWTPISQTNADLKPSAKDDEDATTPTQDQPPRRYKYIPIAVLEEQTNETEEEQAEDDAKPSETELDAAELTSKSDVLDEKPDINDVPMEESQAEEDNPVARQDLNETLDLSLGLKGHDDDNESDSITDQTKDGKLERVNSTSVGT